MTRSRPSPLRTPKVAQLLLGPLLVLAAPGCSSDVGLPEFKQDPVMKDWEARTSYPSCGELTLDQGEQLTLETPEVTCLRLAMTSGKGAELKVTYPTTEGDPITDYYRVTRSGATEIYTDSTQDNFGTKSWSYASCAAPEDVLDVNCSVPGEDSD